MIKIIEGGVCAAAGFSANGFHTGLSKNPTKHDVGIILADNLCNTAAVYTKNKVKGSPIVVTRKHLSNGKAQAVIVNSTNANTCNADGEEKATAMCKFAAEAMGISPDDVIVASTGVIGQPLNIQPIQNSIVKMVNGLSSDVRGSDAIARAIMTTDLRKKELAAEFEIDGKICHIGGISKGSGMIHPNMATLLCFMTTDVAISSEMLQKALSDITSITFNRVSVDGDTSTNDMASILASGGAGNTEISTKNSDFDIFKSALQEIMTYLAKEVARDGEGATKLLECVCSRAKTEGIAEIIAKSVVTSSLVKTAMFGQDANWGRILCAVGYADEEFDITKVSVAISSKAGEIKVCENGSGIEFSEPFAKEVLAEDEIQINVNLHDGNESAIAWGCDLTYNYVKINGDYRS